VAGLLDENDPEAARAEAAHVPARGKDPHRPPAAGSAMSIDVDTHKTAIRFPSLVAVAVFAGFCIWLGGQVTDLRRDVADLRQKHVFSDQEIIERVDKRVDERWTIKRAGVQLRCDQFPSRGVYAGCREITP
jgi:hypothetical protein